MNKLTIDFFRPFEGVEKVTELQTLAMEMQAYGLTATEVVDMCAEYLGNIRAEMAANANVVSRYQPKILQSQPRYACPLCQDALQVSAVNVSKCTNIGGPWNTSLMCSSTECRYTELSEKTLTEWGL